MIPLDRVRELLSLAPGPHGGTLMDTSMVHDLARDVLSLADALATAERERDAALASADLSARAAVDAARELGHVAAAAIARADAADARSANLLMCGEAAERAAEEAHAHHAALAGAVRAYLAAVEAFDGGALGAPCRASIRVDDTRAALVAALEK